MRLLIFPVVETWRMQAVAQASGLHVGKFGLTPLTQRSIVNHMVEYAGTTLDHTFSALADPTRRAIVARLRAGSLSTSALAEPFPISLQAVMKHLDVLAQAGLVTRTKTGRSVAVTLANEPIDEAAEWLDQHRRAWAERLDRLETYLQRIQHGESHDDES